MNVITTKSGNLLTYNIDEWTISKDRNCKIIDENDESYTLENKSKDIVNLSKSLIYDNCLQIIDDTVEISPSLYEFHFIKKIKDREKNLMNDLFNKNIELIFKHQDIVLSKAEYYLIQPALLNSGGSFIGGYNYTLGALFDTFNSDNPFFFEKLSRYKKMHLIRISGSPLSGRHISAFWSDDKSKIIELNSGKIGRLRNSTFLDNFRDFKKEVVRDFDFSLDYQARAIKRLIMEIKASLRDAKFGSNNNIVCY